MERRKYRVKIVSTPDDREIEEGKKFVPLQGTSAVILQEETAEQKEQALTFKVDFSKYIWLPSFNVSKTPKEYIEMLKESNPLKQIQGTTSVHYKLPWTK